VPTSEHADRRSWSYGQQNYERLWRCQLVVDFVRPDADVTGYPLIVVPNLYLTTPEAAAT
jgi:beta-galactosidase GanA